MEKFSKFIIEGENLILMKVTYHKDIAINIENVKGGGWFIYKQDTNSFIFSGDSHDFGAAKLEDIKECVTKGNVFSDNRLYRNISNKHKFQYNTGTELINLN